MSNDKGIKRTAYMGKYATCEVVETYEDGKINFHGTITLNEEVKTAKRIMQNDKNGSTPAFMYFFERDPLK